MFCAMLFARSSVQHGLMIHPPPRNYLAYIRGQEWNSMSLNFGGAQAVSRNGASRWPNGLYGVCGAPAGSTRYSAAGNPVSSLAPGANITVRFVIWNNHGGVVRMRLCKGTACHILHRPGNNSTFWLPRVRGAAGKEHTDTPSGSSQTPQLDGRRDFRWGRVPRRSDGYNNYFGTPFYEVRYQVPRNAERGRSVLMWDWTTAQSCIPPPYAEIGSKNYFVPWPERTRCTAPGATYPEEFRNCADVVVA